MGKALIFNGVTVNSPLQTVTFIKEPVTSDDYINEYAKLATEVTSEQKGYLKTFIETLMTNNLWDKVRSCYPMLGGLSGYNKDLKDVLNQQDWKIPPVGVSWDETRNAPFISLPGFASDGKSIHFSDLNYKNCAFLFSCKSIRQPSSNKLIGSFFHGETNKSFINDLRPSTGGYLYPNWDTPQKNSNIENYTASKNYNTIYLVTLSNGINKLYTNKSYLKSSEMMYIDQENTDISATSTDCYFNIGGGYAAEMEAPANNTFNGCANMFIAFNSALTEEEMNIVSKAVWDFDDACGRHIDFE